ncbi:hypothetical protein TRFO_28548 [Tritrichomonas foetus]|uniref:Importin N-terminal domain-containing protein n=1 Tax=Tritrichomonas foetus TaxID=1144522 RepID=A0A1J4JYE5_9EUKA|nr:hypothetical protein TRFO_28548 [Tritrichomonas foetus]|eukprot:OHT04011.1 hypothetical protein TRFO_28548 [Tritrichomonas foetus]
MPNRIFIQKCSTKIMSDEQSVFTQAIINSLSNTDQATREDGAQTLLAIIENPLSIRLCLQVFMLPGQQPNILHATNVYLHKAIKKHWKFIDDEPRIEIQNVFMQIISSVNLPELTIPTFLSSIKYMYSHDARGWPELLNFMANNTQNVFCLHLAIAIIPKMKSDVITSTKYFFLTLSSSALVSNELKIKLLGLKIFHVFIMMLNEKEGIEVHIQHLMEIMAASESFNAEDLTCVWSCISDLLVLEFIPNELIGPIIEIAFKIGQNNEIDPSTRAIPIESLIPILENFTNEMLMQLFTICIDITASLMESEDKINEQMLSHFDSASSSFDHDVLYPIIQERIQFALNSPSPYHQIAGLLIFRILLQNFPDLVYKDIDFVMNFLIAALSSQTELLKQAALKVVGDFDKTFKSANAYAPKVLPLVMPNIISPVPETRVEAYAALNSIFGILDTKISDFLEKYLQVSAQVPDDNLVQYISLLSFIITTAEDFSDESCDQIMVLINQVFARNDSDTLAACLSVASALLEQDETQLEFVIEKFFPLINVFMQQDNSTIIDETFDFLGNLAHLLRENSLQYFEPFIPAIINFLDDSRITNEVKTGIVINTSKIAKFCNHAELVNHLIPNIINGLKSEEDEFQSQSAVAIKKIKRLINPETAHNLFVALFSCLTEAVEYNDHITDVLLAAGKLIINCDQSNLQFFLNTTVDFIKCVFESRWELLKGKAIHESPSAESLLPPLCHLFSAVVHYPTPINDTICQFLMQWMTKNNELDLFEITGTLADCLEFKHVSEETRQAILNATIGIMGNATEPSLLQNLSYMMNMLVQNDPNLLGSIVQLLPTFEKWRQISSDEKFGYQDVLANLASLYIQIAVRAPEFPIPMIVFSLEQFPPFDINETSSMAAAMMNVVQNKQDPTILTAATLAIARFFVMDESKIQKAKIAQDVKGMMAQFLKAICSQNQQILMQIKVNFGRQKSKLRKIEAILNSP